MTTPRLITPDGMTIELSQETYREIKKLLREGNLDVPKPHRVTEIRETYGKYAGKPSAADAGAIERTPGRTGSR